MVDSSIIDKLAADDEIEASLALKELIARRDVDEIVAAYMDSPDANIRRRMHQLATMSDRRNALVKRFKEVLSDDRLGLWELGVVVNNIVDRCTSELQLNALMEHIASEYACSVESTSAFSKLINELGLRVQEVQERYVTDYLVNDVMLNNCGDETAVCLIAMGIGARCGWPLVPGIYRNVICLRDRMSNVMIPSNGWGVVHVLDREFMEFDKHGFAIHLLGMLRNAAMVDQLPLVMAKIDYLLLTAVEVKCAKQGK